MNEFLQGYIEDLNKRNLSSNTLGAYIRDILQFHAFIEERNESIKDIDNFTIMAFVQFLHKLDKADSSIVRSIVSIRNYYKYLAREGICPFSGLIEYEIPKVERKVPVILTIPEVESLLSIPDLRVSKGIRDRAMLELMYATGIKISEMLNLSVDDIDLNLKFIRCTGTKGKERVIPIGNYAVMYLKQYISCRNEFNKNNSKVLFLNSQGEKMSRQGFWKILKFYADKAKITKDINLYTLRHSFAVHLLQNGADMKSLQELLGHTDINATQIYLDLKDKDKLTEVYKNAHPRA